MKVELGLQGVYSREVVDSVDEMIGILNDNYGTDRDINMQVVIQDNKYVYFQFSKVLYAFTQF